MSRSLLRKTSPVLNQSDRADHPEDVFVRPVTRYEVFVRRERWPRQKACETKAEAIRLAEAIWNDGPGSIIVLGDR